MAGVNGCELLVTPFQPKTARQTYEIAERATVWNSVLEYWNPSPVAWSSSGSFWTAHSNFCLHQCLETLNAYADGLCHQQLTRSTQIKTDILAQVLQVLCSEGLCPRSDSLGLSQETVGVLLPIHSLQILYLDQNVNAFLNLLGPKACILRTAESVLLQVLWKSKLLVL